MIPLAIRSISRRGLLLAAQQNTRSLPSLAAVASSEMQLTPTRFFASAVLKEETAPKRRRTLETKNPIILTERGADRIKELLANQPDAQGIRLGVKRRGCNGLSYTLNYVHEVHAKDIFMEAHGVKIWVEPMALFNIVGTQMDWEETELTSEFTFNNPNSKGECGCGESFNV